MFVQVIKGKVKDAGAVRSMGDRWEQELRPGARGFLGATIGVTDDGTLVNFARFDSRESAVANSQRPEQGAWFAEFEKLFDGPISFRDSEDIVIHGNEDRLDSAGFVQVMEGRTSDVAALKAMNDEMDAALAEERPDVLGGVIVVHPDSTFTQAVYFTSEEEARLGEKKEPSEANKEAMERAMSLFEITEFLDLKEPWLR